MTESDYQRQRVAAAWKAYRDIFDYSGKDALSGQQYDAVKSALSAADAVPRPTQPNLCVSTQTQELNSKTHNLPQPDILSAEGLAYGVFKLIDEKDSWKQASTLIKKRDEAIRNSEREKAMMLVESARLASKLWDQLQQMYDTQDTKEWKKSRSSWPRDIFESYIDDIVEKSKEALTNYESENSHD